MHVTGESNANTVPILCIYLFIYASILTSLLDYTFFLIMFDAVGGHLTDY